MKKITILFLSFLLFSCYPEKKNTQPKEETKTNKVEEVDSSRSKAISKEKGADDIPDDYSKEMERYFEGELGPV